jgi:hypothetical protein
MGAATVSIAEVNGRFEGELTVTDRLVVRVSGQLNGRWRD